MMLRSSIYIGGVIFFILFFNYFSVVGQSDEIEQLEYRAGEVLVKIEGDEEVVKLNFPDGNAEAISRQFKQQQFIEYAEPNYLFSAGLEPLDKDFVQQVDFLRKIKAPEAWDITTGSRSTIIAVLDTGVSIENPDLKGNIWRNENEIPANGKDDDGNGFVDDINGWDFTTNSPDPKPKFEEGYSEIGVQHGTIIAGLAAARGGNDQGVAGVTWHSQIMPLRVL